VSRRQQKKSEPTPPTQSRILPMELQLGDRLTDETGEYEIIGRPYTTQMGKNVHVRVQRVDNAEVTTIRMYAAHEREWAAFRAAVSQTPVADAEGHRRTPAPARRR
jgi:hypothetical protein